jgi:UDP-2,3-diacylglucosamine pyrophosphatase LpxH
MFALLIKRSASAQSTAQSGSSQGLSQKKDLLNAGLTDGAGNTQAGRPAKQMSKPLSIVLQRPLVQADSKLGTVLFTEPSSASHMGVAKFSYAKAMRTSRSAGAHPASRPEFPMRNAYFSPFTGNLNPNSVVSRHAPSAPAGHDRNRNHRTIFISDVHLGTRACKAEALADFLAWNACDTLFLVGDIVDGWRLKRRWLWPEGHSRVVREILRKVDEGTRVIYVPGNHDEAFREYCGRNIAGVEIAREAVHETADGKSLLVVHGDQFDGVIACAKWLAHLGDSAYTAALQLSEIFCALRRALGLPYWSLSAYLKRKVKNAVEYVCRFQEAVVREARERGFDGVVCGHIHHAAMEEMDGVLYLNDGDWVESCTALVEDARGHLSILHWPPFAEPSDVSPVAEDKREMALVAA